MAVSINLPTVLRKLAGGKQTLEASGATLGDVINQVCLEHPDLAPRLKDDTGEPYPFVTFYLNDDDIRFNGGFSAPVKDGDELTIVPAIAGG